MESKGLMSKPGFKYGLFLGIILSIIWLIMYFMDPVSLFNSTWKTWLTAALMAGAIGVAMQAKKTMSGGFIKYGNAVAAGLGVALVASTITVITAALLHFVIDTTLFDQSKPVLIEKQTEMAEKMLGMFGADEDMIEEQMEQMEGELDKIRESELTFGTFILGGLGSIATYVFIGLVLSLLIAIGIKKNPPPFFEENKVTSEDLAP